MDNGKKILLTGSTGFVGSATSIALKRQGYDVVSVSKAGRDGSISMPFEDTTDWTRVLHGVECVVHTAARVHVMKENASDAAAYWRMNVVPTLNLAEQAANKGVKRFIFVSSAKVGGESNFSENAPLNEGMAPLPVGPYSWSKYEAEAGLFSISLRAGLEVVVIRPPLVYGPGVGANFQALIKLVALGIPLPFGSVTNLRSFVGINNLVSFILECVRHPAAANEIFYVSDNRDLSTKDLVILIGQALNKKGKLFKFSPLLMNFLGLLACKKSVVDRLCGSLQVDVSKATVLLGWTPSLSVEEQLKLTVTEFLSTNPHLAVELKKSNA